MNSKQAFQPLANIFLFSEISLTYGNFCNTYFEYTCVRLDSFSAQMSSNACRIDFPEEEIHTMAEKILLGKQPSISFFKQVHFGPSSDSMYEINRSFPACCFEYLDIGIASYSAMFPNDPRRPL